MKTNKGSNGLLSNCRCWISSAPDSHGVVVSYVTVSGYLGLVFLFNTAILGVVVVKLWGQRGKGRMWKDWATVLGLSCVLGVPWGLAFCTYGPLSLPGLYLFSIFNCFQGQYPIIYNLSKERYMIDCFKSEWSLSDFVAFQSLQYYSYNRCLLVPVVSCPFT